METILTINGLLFIMASISPKVKDAIERENYRISTDGEEATDQYILEDALVNLISDLKEIGLTFDTDFADYATDMGMLSSFIQVAQLLLPSSLYELLKADTSLRQMIQHVVEGSLGNNETAIVTYLTELGGLDGTAPLRPHLVEYLDGLVTTVQQTEVFTDYLRNLLELHQDERPSVFHDDERHTAYRDYVRDLIGKVSDAVNLFETYASFTDLTTVQQFFIHDLIAPTNFTEYAYLFLESKETLPDELYAGWLRKWEYYFIGNPWCFEYYKARGNSPSIMEMPWKYRAFYLCLTYALSPDKEVFLTKISEMMRYYPISLELANQILPLYGQKD